MFIKKKILILKNDRGGDLLNSLKCISSLFCSENSVTILLSQLNIGFSFLFKKAKIIKTNYDLNFFNKLQIFFLLFKESFSEVYILSPKKYYYYLAVIFKQTKFFAITVDGEKRLRPSLKIRKFLFKYRTINRKKINIKSSSELQLELIENNKIDNNYKNITRPTQDNFILKNLPLNFLFIQYKNSFYSKINMSGEKFFLLTNSLKGRYKNIVFCSDIEETNSNKIFYNICNVIDFKERKIYLKDENPNIFYLHAINVQDLFSVVEKAEMILSPHGLITHISNFYKKKSLSLFNFEINNSKDLKHQKIAFSEWYKNMNLHFLFLNNNIDRSLNKIIKNL
jgi:hypothetical protein